MTIHLYYSISASLNEDEILKIDKEVLENRKLIYFFVKNFYPNFKSRIKKVFLHAMILFQLDQSLAGCAAAVIMPIPSVGIHRLSSLEQNKNQSNKNYSFEISNVNNNTIDKVKFTQQEIEDLNLICYKLQNGSININQAILELRGGDLFDWASLAFIIAMYKVHQATSMKTNVPMPHMDPFGWISGKYNKQPKPMNYSTYRSSRFQLEMDGVNDNMCSSTPDEEGFVMSYEDAYNLVKETYPGYLEVTENCILTDWQCAKKIYHSKGMGINPEEYGFTQKELERIRGEKRYKEGGLVAYARRGYRLPTIKMIHDYRSKIKGYCDKATIKRTSVPYYDINGVWNTTVFAIPATENSSSIIISFNESTRDLITADKQKQSTFNRFNDENYLGSKQWMNKWTK